MTSLNDRYVFSRPDEVHEFLDKHTFLVPLLEEAYTRVRECFPCSPLLLEVRTDPEDAENTQLVALIATEDAPAKAFAKLQELDRAWWLDAMDRAQGKFHINLTFR